MSRRLPTKAELTVPITDVEIICNSFAAIVKFIDDLRVFGKRYGFTISVPSGVVAHELFVMKNFAVDSVLVAISGARNNRSISLYTPFGEVRSLAKNLSDAITNQMITSMLPSAQVTLQHPLLLFNNGTIAEEKWMEPYEDVRVYAVWQSRTLRFGAGFLMSHIALPLRNCIDSALFAQVSVQQQPAPRLNEAPPTTE